MFVPGGAAVKGVSTALRYAKSAFENGLNAADFFNGWVGDACGVPKWDFSLEGMFLDAVNAPDSMMGSASSIGCVRKAKSKCQKRDPAPDPKTEGQLHRGSGNKDDNNNSNNNDPDPDKATHRPKPTETKDAPNPTKTKEPTKTKSQTEQQSTAPRPSQDSLTTQTNEKTSTTRSEDTTRLTTSAPQTTSACRIGKRAPPPAVREGRIADFKVESASECHQGATTHFRTTTDRNIGYYVPPVEPQTCKKKWGQACSHYR